MSNIKYLNQGFQQKTNIVFLRFNIDTLGEHFIYEEAEHFRKYSPIVLCGMIKRIDKKIAYYCHKEFSELYQLQWPIFPKTHEDIYQKGIIQYQRILDERNIQLIHAQFLTDAIFCYRLIKESNLPLVINLRGYDLFVSKFRSSLSRFYPFISKFLVKSNSMKNELVSLGCDPALIEVIYGGINTDNIVFKPRIPRKDNIKMLCAGRFTDKKGFDITLKFFYRFLKRCPDAELTLVGEGKLKDSVIKLVKYLGIEPKVNIKDYMPHKTFIKELYRHNLFLLPSRTAKDGDKEGIPNVLKEAMASGMPVVSTNHSGIPELITDNKTGYLVQENDYSGILEKVNFILNNGEQVFQSCLNARFFVEKNFDTKKTAKRVESLYDYLLMPGYVKSAIDLNQGKRPSEYRVDLHLNKGCNSKCIMCDNWRNQITTSYSREDVSRVLNQLQSFGVDHVRFHGQEPTLMQDIFSIMKEAKSKGFRIGLKTNALIFSTEQKVKKLDGLLDDLYLSVDASKENVHNLLRGNKQSFSRNVFLAKVLKKINPNVQIYFNTVVTRLNYRDLIGLLDMADSLKVDRVSFVQLSTNNKDDIDDLKLTKKQFKEFYFQIWPRILKKSLDYNIPVCIDPYFTSLIGLPINLQIGMLNSTPEIFNEEIDNFTDGLYGRTFYSQNACYGFLDHATVDWEGNVFPCCAMPRFKALAMGNLHDNSYSKIWNSDKYVKYRESILRGECQFKDQCSRVFNRSVEYNKCFKNEDYSSDNHGALEHFRNQNRDNEYINNYNREKLIYYSFAKSEIYRKKFRKLINSDRKPNISELPVTKRNELKNFFPKKEIIPNYFEEDYGIFRTSSRGSKAFLYARPLKSNIFDRMSASFVHTGEWNIGQPWLKLTALNCLEAQYPLKEFSISKRRKPRLPSATIIPASDNFINESILEIKKAYDLIRNSKAPLIHANPTHLKILLYRFHQEKMLLDKHYAVHSTYEILLPSTQKLIKKYLNCTVFNQYGCSEVGPISFNCSRGNNHIFSDTVHVEVVPAYDLNRPEIGRVTVTHLKNFVMPFIKYFNGDFAYILKDKKCGCGLSSPIMGDIVGREDEIIDYKGKIVFPLELDRLFYDLENILMYQVVFENEHFVVKLVVEDKTGHIPAKKIISKFKGYFKDKKLQVDVENVNFILPMKRGKYASVVVK